MKEGLYEFDIGYEEVDELDLTDLWLDEDEVLVLYLIDDPLFLLPKYHKAYSMASLRTHMYFSLVM